MSQVPRFVRQYCTLFDSALNLPQLAPSPTALACKLPGVSSSADYFAPGCMGRHLDSSRLASQVFVHQSVESQGPR
jgi:hypothetical protein